MLINYGDILLILADSKSLKIVLISSIHDFFDSLDQSIQFNLVLFSETHDLGRRINWLYLDFKAHHIRKNGNSDV